MGHILMVKWGRSGSTVLGNMLAQHPDLHWMGEPFRGKMLLDMVKPRSTSEYNQSRFFPHNPVGYLRHCMRRRRAPRFGCDVKPYHITMNGLTFPGFLANAALLGFDTYLMLTRRNYLRQLISAQVAKIVGFHHARPDETVTPTKLVLDCLRSDRGSIVETFQRWDAELAELRLELSRSRVLELRYEDDIQDDPRHAYEKVCTFADLRPAPVSVRFQRTNPFPLEEQLENLDEVRAHLAGTPYAWMVEADS